MTMVQLLVAGWQRKPEGLGGCAHALSGYFLLVRPLTARALSFVAGVLVLLVSLVSPLDTLAHTYLFSAHMAQHLLMVLIVPPLLLLGIPPQFARRVLEWAPARGLERTLAHPLAAWALANGAMWVWHLPALYDLALGNNGIHILQHLIFLTAARLFWWPVLAPATGGSSLAPWAAILYLFTAMAAGSVLGIILTFAPPGLYRAYLQPVDTLGLLPLIRDGWGLPPEADQQFGGLLMWIPGGFVYSLAMIGTLVRWFGEPESDTVPLAPAAELP